MSEATAKSLKEGGKESWCIPRSTPIKAKGKGDIYTYWLRLPSSTDESDGMDISENPSLDGPIAQGVQSEAELMHRLVDWNCEQLTRLLKQIVARRSVLGESVSSSTKSVEVDMVSIFENVLSEVQEIIFLPEFSAKVISGEETNLDKVLLDEDVTAQLREYITCVAQMYRTNPFHNFEHASHGEFPSTHAALSSCHAFLVF